MDVRTLMERSATFYADRECIVWRDRRLTFRQAWDRGVRLANALLGMGLKPGDRVGVLEDNSIEAADFFLGAAIANIVRVPLYARDRREMHLHMLGHTNCRAVLVAEHYAGDMDGFVDELPDLERVIVRDGGYEDWLMKQSAETPDIKVDPDDKFIIRHTGGTTGRPKGVAYSHRAWLAAGRDWFYLFPPVEPGDVCLHVGPISHGSGYQFLPVFLGGGCNLLLDHFHPGETLEIMEKERVAYAFFVPTMLNTMLQDPSAETRDFSKLKCILAAAAPIADATALKAYEVFGDAMYQGYGQTEVLPVAIMGPRQWFAEIEGSTPLRACGMPLPYIEVQIWDEANNPVPLGDPGEIVAKSDGQMTEFWNNPEATAERIVDGWVKTGDVGRLDANGYLYILDRADDMIISGGYNIWPLELENVIADLPGVVEVAVFGVPHERWGETPMALCVLDGSHEVTEDDVIRTCTERLGSYKKPSQVVFRKEPLPKSPVGKIRRKELREPYWEGVDRRVAGS
ncbi:MAG: AMP-dependent synthetase [Rhizobiales bacterium NRL2]|jgi:acyl-CoA synthetase (AMP-forming)/AMP-acid ligase II|nr:MAG: AMP-dependent synthetase [Rhizobiales bacterium NRL2]